MTATDQELQKSGGNGAKSLPPEPKATQTVVLSSVETDVIIKPPDLRERVTTRVLDLFGISLIGTLTFAAILVMIDVVFILLKVITPAERLMTQQVVMTFVTATVVQVGAALAAIVFAVFKTDTQGNGETPK